MRKLATIMTLTLAAICLCGCDADKEGTMLRKEFEANASSVSLEIMGEELMRYTEDECQMSYNPDNWTFRVMDDEAKNYFQIKLDSAPVEDETCIGTIKWTTASDTRERKNIEFKVLKVESGTLWLWNQKIRIGAVVKTL